MFLRFAAFILRLRRSLGFSKCWWRRRSAMIPAFSHFFLKRRRALSKASPSFTLMPGNLIPPSLRRSSVKKEIWVVSHCADDGLHARKQAGTFAGSVWPGAVDRQGTDAAGGPG